MLEGWSTRNFVDRHSRNRTWWVSRGPVTKYFGSMEANSLLHNFLPYLDPVTLGVATDEQPLSSRPSRLIGDTLRRASFSPVKRRVSIFSARWNIGRVVFEFRISEGRIEGWKTLKSGTWFLCEPTYLVNTSG